MKLVNEFVKMINNYEELKKILESEKRIFGNVELYSSEMHTLVYIYDNPNESFSDIARGMDISKGALTKIVNKIEKKKMIVRYKRI